MTDRTWASWVFDELLDLGLPVLCPFCGEPLERRSSTDGRLPRYCSRRCRQKAYLRRRKAREVSSGSHVDDERRP